MRNQGCGAMLVVVMVGAAACSRPKADADAGPAPSSTTSAAPAVRPGPGVPPGALAVMRQYGASDDCSGRADTVLTPKGNAAAMATWIATHGGRGCAYTLMSVEGSSSEDCDVAPVGSWCAVHAVASDAPDTRYQWQLKRVSADAFRIDWRANYGYNPVGFAAFRAARPKSPTLFRVSAQLADYYNYAWMHAQETHYSLKVHEPKGTTDITAYVLKQGNAALFELLKDGKDHPVMLAMQHRVGSAGDVVDGTVVQLNWHELPADFAPTP